MSATVSDSSAISRVPGCFSRATSSRMTLRWPTHSTITRGNTSPAMAASARPVNCSKRSTRPEGWLRAQGGEGPLLIGYDARTVVRVRLRDLPRLGRLLDAVKHDHPNLPVIVISGHGNIETAVSAIRRGHRVGATFDAFTTSPDTRAMIPAPLTVTARTYNSTSTGTYGQYIPAVTVAESASASDRALGAWRRRDPSRGA